MILYGRSTSDNVQKILWTLGEIDHPFEQVELGGVHGGLDDPAYRALNPHGKVPTLCDGEVVIWESATIVRYLAARYSTGDLWPEGPGDRAAADMWMTWCQQYPAATANRLFWLTIRTPEDQQDREEIGRTLDHLQEELGRVEARLERQRFLAGDRLTMADIPLGAELYRHFNLPVERASFPAVERWYEDLTARPAYQRAVMVSFEELRGRLSY